MKQTHPFHCEPKATYKCHFFSFVVSYFSHIFMSDRSYQTFACLPYSLSLRLTLVNVVFDIIYYYYYYYVPAYFI